MATASRRRVSAALVVAFLTTAPLVRGQTPQENAADAERLIAALNIQSGSIVGEIGAGGGELTLAMAKAVGETGRVYSNELNKERLKAIGESAATAGFHNVTPVEGAEAATNFPDACCDAIFMRNVYHHFGDPPAMNASLLKSLKPGGRLAILDFTPPPGQETAAPGKRGEDGHHGVRPATVEQELKGAGFEIVTSGEANRTVTVIARRPAAGGV
jgi:ubiquinone/menaquinone biosynthesis C-methylase UbiE